MFGIGSTEFLVILVVALIVMGPEKLPQIARGLGKAISELKRMSTDLQRTINLEIEKQEHQDRVKQAEEELGLNKEKQPEQAAAPSPDPKPMDKAYESAMSVNQSTPFAETTPSDATAEKPSEPAAEAAAAANSPTAPEKVATEKSATESKA